MLEIIKPLLKDLLSKYSDEDVEGALSSICEKIKNYQNEHNSKARIVLEQHHKNMVVTLQMVSDGKLKTDENCNKKTLSDILKAFSADNELPMQYAVILPAIPGLINNVFNGFAKEKKPKKIIFFLQNDKIVLQINTYETQITIENGTKYSNNVLVEQQQSSPKELLDTFLGEKTIAP